MTFRASHPNDDVCLSNCEGQTCGKKVRPSEKLASTLRDSAKRASAVVNLSRRISQSWLGPDDSLLTSAHIKRDGAWEPKQKNSRGNSRRRCWLVSFLAVFYCYFYVSEGLTFSASPCCWFFMCLPFFYIFSNAQQKPRPFISVESLAERNIIGFFIYYFFFWKTTENS